MNSRDTQSAVDCAVLPSRNDPGAGDPRAIFQHLMGGPGEEGPDLSMVVPWSQDSIMK